MQAFQNSLHCIFCPDFYSALCSSCNTIFVKLRSQSKQVKGHTLEDISKNHPGGLQGWKYKPKVATHHANIENPSRCLHVPLRSTTAFVHLIGHMMHFTSFLWGVLHTTIDSPVYGTCWLPQLANTFYTMWKLAGIVDYNIITPSWQRQQHNCILFRNWRAVSNEQTGHSSTGGVCSYKRTSNETLLVSAKDLALTWDHHHSH